MRRPILCILPIPVRVLRHGWEARGGARGGTGIRKAGRPATAARWGSPVGIDLGGALE